MARQRAADYREKSQQIIDTAAALIAANGYHPTSMASIAGACGVSKALLYHYYEDKDAILFDIVSRNVDHYIAVIMGVDQQDLAPQARLRAIIATLLEAFRHSSDEHQVIMSNLQFLPKPYQDQIKDKERQLARVVARAISEACPNLKDSEFLMPATMSLLSILLWQYMWFREDGPITSQQFGEFVSHLFFAGVNDFDPSAAAKRPGTK
ncbi:MAG: TetR/AcrR family transcriptional regulator [Rhizobiaceae bacterium]